MGIRSVQHPNAFRLGTSARLRVVESDLLSLNEISPVDYMGTPHEDIFLIEGVGGTAFDVPPALLRVERYNSP